MPGWRLQTSLFHRGLPAAGLSCRYRAGPPANSSDLTAHCGSPLAQQISHGAGAAEGCGRHSQVFVLGSATMQISTVSRVRIQIVQTLMMGTLPSPPPSGPSEHTRAQERECRWQRAEMWPRPGIRSHHLPFSTTSPHLPATPILSDEATSQFVLCWSGQDRGAWGPWASGEAGQRRACSRRMARPAGCFPERLAGGGRTMSVLSSVLNFVYEYNSITEQVHLLEFLFSKDMNPS